jgi:hypothetical protein
MAIEATGGVFPATRIDGNTSASAKGTWLFALLWNTVSAPILYYIPPELDRNPIAAIGFVFPVAGVGLLAWAVTITLRGRRFGKTWLETAAGTPAPGHTWSARVHARLPEPQDGGYRVMVRLTCLRRTDTRNDSERAVQERIVWREEVEVPSTSIAFGAGGASLTARFDLPADALETTAVGNGEGTLWVLTAEAALPGVNFKEDFDVPVRRIAGGSEDLQPRAGGTRDAQLRAGISVDDLARTGIRVEPAAGGMSVTFGAMRNVAFAAGVSAFTAVWTGALWLQWRVGFPWIFPIVTGLFDLLLLYIAIDLWLGVTTVTAGTGALRVRHTLLGMGGTRVIDAADVAAIELHISMQTQGRHGTPYYQVRARLKNGRKASLGGSVRNKRHAEWLAAQMRSSIGMKSD